MFRRDLNLNVRTYSEGWADRYVFSISSIVGTLSGVAGLATQLMSNPVVNPKQICTWTSAVIHSGSLFLTTQLLFEISNDGQGFTRRARIFDVNQGTLVAWHVPLQRPGFSGFENWNTAIVDQMKAPYVTAFPGVAQTKGIPKGY